MSQLGPAPFLAVLFLDLVDPNGGWRRRRIELGDILDRLKKKEEVAGSGLLKIEHALDGPSPLKVDTLLVVPSAGLCEILSGGDAVDLFDLVVAHLSAKNSGSGDYQPK